MTQQAEGTAPGFDRDWLNVLGKMIGGLERFQLEGVTPDEFDLSDLLDEDSQVFYSIQGLADFWKRAQGVDFGQYMTDIVIAAHTQRKADLTLIMIGTPQKLSLYLSLGSQETTRTILEGVFPGIMLEPCSASELFLQLEDLLYTKGVLTGIPSRKAFGQDSRQSGGQEEQKPGGSSQQAQPPAADRQNQSQLERIIRGMHGTSWAYIVQAHPRPRNKVVEERMKTIDLLTQVTSRSRVQWQSTQQGSRQMTSTESGSTTHTYSGDMVSYRAQYLNKLLERELERLDQAGAAGQWIVHTYFGSTGFDETQRLASLLLGTLAGKDSRPEPLRAALCRRGGVPLSNFSTFLTSEEVATLVQLPREEVPGYAIHDHVRFDVDFRAPKTLNLPLGHIQQNGRDIQDTFNISVDALAKHAVVVGVTGSGKTTTVMSLLDRVAEAGKSFLVIEPAKAEYRSLRTALASMADLHIYTLGNEMVAPFRLNPFEFETSDEPGSGSLLSHIDFLKAVFNAAFALYPPMPHVLEEALHEVYEDKGWDVASSTNRRVPDWSKRHLYPIFPTLTDLYYKVEIVTTRLRYHHELDSNVKAALKARIGSLRIGSKGLMLDTTRGIPMGQLLSTPAILEMENIGNDDEKTFLMGLFLAKLYEFRRLQAATGSLPGGMQHLIVFEEAHRLLQNTSTQVSNETANPRAQAIETFANILSEMRAYGQGVLVAEQIPSKLAPDVMKNTNLKIVHRLIAQDDRQSIGQTMNLNDEQQVHLGVLLPGMAAVYAEGADHAYLVRLPNYKKNLQLTSDAQLRLLSREYASIMPYHEIPEIESYGIPISPFGGPEPAVYQAAGKLLASEKSSWLWANILLRTTLSPAKLLEMLMRLSEQIEADMSYLPPEQHDIILRLLIIRGSAHLLQERGGRFGWSYPEVEELRTHLTQGLLAVLRSYQLSHADMEKRYEPEELANMLRSELIRAGECLEAFVTGYEAHMKRRQGPFVGCVHCQARCLYRPEVSILLSPKDSEWIERELTSDAHQSAQQRYGTVAAVGRDLARRWLGDEREDLPGVSYCAILHAVSTGHFSEYEQELVGDSVSALLLTKKDGS